MSTPARARTASTAWLLLAACLVVPGSPPRAADVLEAIPLHYRLAEELVPLLQPLLPPGAAVTGTGDVLLVRGDAATLRQVREALATLDRAPRQLLITVGQATDAARQSSGVRGSATIGTGDVQVGVNQPPGAHPGAQVTVHDQATRADVQGTSTVRALEGREVYVSVGESRPVTTTTVIGGDRHRPVVSQATDYRDARSGFYATPRVSGDRVTLEISPTQQAFARSAPAGTVATQTLHTTVSGRLGEWLELGGVADERRDEDSGLVTWGTRSELTRYSAWVKVEEIRQ
ncbi:MAG TPA: secretin N-terminal domain-containing protein [Steroidobacteraceae bacterium]|nr:secretin N-terminal domain-containing protein [Steroidobacteraceae bacterium]